MAVATQTMILVANKAVILQRFDFDTWTLQNTVHGSNIKAASVMMLKAAIVLKSAF
jgi:hypothetical protein